MKETNDPIVLCTERFSARPWDPDNDAEGAFSMYGDPDVVRYIGNRLVPNIDDQRERLRALQDRWAPFGGRYGSWPLFERATGELVGAALLKPLPLSGANLTTLGADIEIGWHVAKRHWGRGIATEMGRALLQRGFEVLDLEMLHAVVDLSNPASQRVAEKIGMRRVGRTHAYYDQEVEHFEMKREEWLKRPSSGSPSQIRKPFVVISGLPGSGKTTLGRRLAAVLKLPLIDKDDILDQLFDSKGIGDAAWRRTLSRESDVILQNEAMNSYGAILASFWRLRGMPADSGTPTDWLDARTHDVVNVHCTCELEVAARRFLQRRRHPGHLDRESSSAQVLMSHRKLAQLPPLDIGQRIDVDTSHEPDLTEVVLAIRGALELLT